MKTLKAGKKLLSVLLSMLIIMTSCVTVAPSFAADEIRVEGEHHYAVSLERAATCTANGFKVWSCIDDGCNASYIEETDEKLGHIWVPYTLEPTCDEMGNEGRKCDREGCGEIELDPEKYIPALGHDMSAWEFVGQAPDGNNVPTYYYNMRNCGRDGCGYIEHETEGDSIVKYYKVDFENEWVANKYHTAEDGTKLAYDEWTSDYYNVDTKTYFVKENGTANVYDAAKPSRAKTEAYGEYVFTGWKSGDTLYPTNVELEAFKITENTTFKAQFKGVVKEYTVIFYGYENVQKLPDGFSSYTYVHVNHGDKITYNPARRLVPVSSDKDMSYNYYFNGWDLKYVPAEEKPLVENPNENYQYGDAVTTVKIYSDHSVHPAFGTIPKKYKVIFHDPNGNIIYNVDGEGSNGVVFGYGESVVAKAPVFDLAQPPFANDPAYYYEFGTANFRQYRWKYENGNFADISALSVPTGTAEYEPVAEENEWMEDEDKGIIHLYPNIVRLAKYYSIELTVYDIDGMTPAKGATVQITDIVPEGQAAHLIGSRYTVGADGKVMIRVPYATSASGTMSQAVYQVTASLDGRKVESYITDSVMDDAVAGHGSLTIMLQEPSGDDKDKGCTCICHSFFGKIYIFFLNVIYKMTGRKIVCCYDMYIRHGDELAYGQQG